MASKNSKRKDCDIAVVGGGLAGLTAAVRLAEVCNSKNWSLLIVAETHDKSDNRTSALHMPSIHMIDKLGVWKDCKEHSAPLKTMRLIDGSDRLIRAPVTEFTAQEINEDAFGYNIPNQTLLTALRKRLTSFDNVHTEDGLVLSSKLNAENVTLELEYGANFTAKFVVAADGSQSRLRSSAAIKINRWQYNQSAVILTFEHEIPHHFVSNEFHTKTGPMTQVPLPCSDPSRYRSSLVWVVTPEQAANLTTTSVSDLEILVEDNLQSMFGRIKIEDKVRCFPLSGMTVDRYGANRIALVGEAAHVFPPIGAQGFNLGLRDVSDLAEILEKMDLTDTDDLLQQYTSKRLSDARSRTFAVDLLNRSLLTDFLPVQIARATVLSLAGSNSILRQFFMKQGMGPSGWETGQEAKFQTRSNTTIPSL